MLLETERLFLRPFMDVDVPSLYALLSDREFNTYLPWFPVTSLKESEQFYL